MEKSILDFVVSNTFHRPGRYILHDYDSRSPVSNFLPGVAGVFGKPVWSFYVNRGQAMASFGLASKDFPMLEFNPANKAYQQTPYVGFRTFVTGTRSGSNGMDGESFLFEPFSPANSKIQVRLGGGCCMSFCLT